MRYSTRLNFNSASATFVALLHLAVANFFYFRGVLNEVYYWAALFIFIALPVYLIAALRNRFIIYEAVFLILFGFTVNYTAVLFWNPDTINSYDHEGVVSVMKLLIGGTLFFLVGYYIKAGKILAAKLPIRNLLISREQILRFSLKFYFVGWFLRIVFQILGVPLFEGWRILSTVMGGSVHTALMIDAFVYFSSAEFSMPASQKKRILARLMFFLVLEVVYAIIYTGMRELVILPFILIFVVYIKAKKKIPYILIITFIIFAVTFVMPFIAAFRSKHWFGGTATESFKHAFATISDKEESIKGNEAALKRLSSSLYLAVVCIEKKKEGLSVQTYENPMDYVSRFIPRFLWPTKPYVDYNLIGKKLGIIGEGDVSTSVGLPLMASMILNNGPVGAILTFFIIGIIGRILWEWLIVRTGANLLAFIVYFNTIYLWMRDEEFYVSLHSTLSFIIYIYIFFGFVSRSKLFNR
ncbi:MAG: hypothetical protein ABH843_07820 [Candidatus Omnitrophota bacterium]